MASFILDEDGRYIIPEYSRQRAFASFLPGLAGPDGIPLWAFYVNRGQALASFGANNKDNPISEFQPANKAYQLTPFTGFRTFIKTKPSEADIYEPFSSTRAGERRQWMAVGANELELVEENTDLGLRVSVLYFTLPGENYAALVRRVTLENLSAQTLDIEMLDGLGVLAPFGVNDVLLKNMSRTLEAWMVTTNLEVGAPFFRLLASVADTAGVEEVSAGNFYLSLLEEDPDRVIPVLVDPTMVFGSDTSLLSPRPFLEKSLEALMECEQITEGRTPCAFSSVHLSLEPASKAVLSSLAGHISSLEKLRVVQKRVKEPGYFSQKHQQARQLAESIMAAAETQTAYPLFDAYCRQNMLDNSLRGGLPVPLGSPENPHIFHIYSRKHGDLERDYNAFYLAAEYYSQGNGNYRDVNQNRRCDVLLCPQVGDFNVRTFTSLIQADGYNPLVIQGSRFSLTINRCKELLELSEEPDRLEAMLSEPFTPGQLLRRIEETGLSLKIDPKGFLERALSSAEQSFEAIHGEGYWTDHWSYLLDQVESFLDIYPDRREKFLFSQQEYTFYDSEIVVQPRCLKYVLDPAGPRQLHALAEDPEKAALIGSRKNQPHMVRLEGGKGEICRTSLFVKLVSLAAVKTATLDPEGMGIEMEAGRPGWYDALNGLPGLFGSSMPDTYELLRLLEFLLAEIRQLDPRGALVELPKEVYQLLKNIYTHIHAYFASSSQERAFLCWDGLSSAREEYRQVTRFGFSEMIICSLTELESRLVLFRQKVMEGVQKALNLNGGVPPTYFSYELEEFDLLKDQNGAIVCDGEGRPYLEARRFRPNLLPLFLEGPVRYLKTQSGRAQAENVYQQVKNSLLYDQKLKMYKLNASLAGMPQAIGRARAFTPGWLENESIWLHMEYKYLLELVRCGLYESFYEEFRQVLIPFQPPERYGRSPLENSSFLVSSAHPDSSLHGGGFVARLSGATAEFISLWHLMMVGERPFQIKDGQLTLCLRPILPGWLFDDQGRLTFTFLGKIPVSYHNPSRRPTYGSEGVSTSRICLHMRQGERIDFETGLIPSPYAEIVRTGQVESIEIFLN